MQISDKAYAYMWLTKSDVKVLLTAHVFKPHILLTITLVNDIFLREPSHILLRITLVNDIFLRETSHILLRITLVNDIFLRQTSHILLRITLVNDIFNKMFHIFLRPNHIQHLVKHQIS